MEKFLLRGWRAFRCADWLKIGETFANLIIVLSAFYIGYNAWHYGRWAFLSDQFIIPTDSMLPTLIPGDRIVVNKLLMGPRIYTDFHFPKQGGDLHAVRLKGMRGVRHNDIVVFNYPINDGRIAFKINYVYCKRVIALPGDSLSIVEGHYRNNNFPATLGIEQEQERLWHNSRIDTTRWGAAYRIWPHNDSLRWTMTQAGPYYIPRRDDVVALTAREGLLYRRLLQYETGKGVMIDWEGDRVLIDSIPTPYHRFQHNYYFVAGDNVDDSHDSRYFGLLPEEYIVGVAHFISYSQHRRTGEYRWHRFLKNILPPAGAQ